MLTTGNSDIFERLRETEDALGPCVVISLTETMLKKSIIDAVEPLRTILRRTGAHDYAAQEQGVDNRVYLGAQVLVAGQTTDTRASLYRPVTKQGDPRFWVYGLTKACRPGDQVAVTVGRDGRLIIVALRAEAWDRTRALLERRHNQLGALPEAVSLNPALDELISKLKELADGPALPALVVGDTAVGRTLEHALGISMNSSKAPDYKGIELKSNRQRPVARRTRSTLFAQVPDWDLSPCPSSRDILYEFGYERDGVLRFYCELGATPNSLGVYLQHDPLGNRIEERSTRPDLPVVARWRIPVLEQRLLEKHNETAWVSVSSTTLAGVEHFRPISVLYTSAPRVDVFPLLIGSGLVTLDHLIKQTGNRVSEKGPLWKLQPDGHKALFGETRSIPL